MIGKTVSHYKILEKLGGGGMGIVYKAQDLKLDRFVALKFLPPYLSTSDEEKQRFIHEAKAASALDHSNICTIFEIGETKEGQLFIAMAYYEGETLKQKIARRPLPLKEVVDIATQIAAGLSKAHEAGIIHRDIKPANIIVTKEGEVKIVDFGLAKLTGQTKLTKPGSTLGTISYMSPEQLRGEKTDSRSDIWSLGVVIYEMLTGQLPFKGDYEQAITYAILNEEPEPITALRTGVPVEFERIVNKTLAKDQKQRYQHVEEVPVDLKSVKVSTTHISKKITTSPTKLKSWLRVLPWIPIALLTFFIISRHQVSSPISVKRLHINLPEDAPLDPIGSVPYNVGQRALALSPQGDYLVYIAGISGETQLYLRSLNGYEVTPLGGTKGAFFPFFSPDGRWIGFFTEKELKKVEITTGTTITLCQCTYPSGACWGADGRIFFAHQEGDVFSWVPEEGGLSKDLTLNTSTILPEIIPGTNIILAYQLFDKKIKAIDIDTGKEHIILEGFWNNPRYLPSGHLMVERGGRLEVFDFDTHKLKTIGSPIPVLFDVRTEAMDRHVQYTLSGDGTLAYLSGGVQTIGQLMWVNREGEETLLPFPANEYMPYQISHDGKRLAIPVVGPERIDIWIYDLETGMKRTLTHQDNNYDPIWSFDGSELVFISDRHGQKDLYIKSVDGGGEPELLIKNAPRGRYPQPSSWSHDGRYLAYCDAYQDNNWEIFVYDKHKDTIQAFTNTRFVEWGATFSPNGRWIAYVSTEQGVHNVYVEPFPQTGAVYPIPAENSVEPMWSQNTKELFFFASDKRGSKWMVVPYETEPSFKFGKPEVLIVGDYLDLSGKGWDVHPDGQRFLLVKRLEEYKKKYMQINVVMNWFEELKSKFEAGN